jgi:hypothetical protein
VNIPTNHKLYQMAIKCIKGYLYILFQRLLKIYQNSQFWYSNVPSGFVIFHLGAKSTNTTSSLVSSTYILETSLVCIVVVNAATLVTVHYICWHCNLRQHDLVKIRVWGVLRK